MKSYFKHLVLAGVTVCSASLYANDAPPMIFHLKNGDRITAIPQIRTETNLVVLTAFGSTITLPLDQIVSRTTLPLLTETAPAVETPAPAEVPVPAEAPAPTPAPEAAPDAAADAAKVVEEKTEPVTFVGKFFSNFAGEVQVGMDAGYGASDYMNYYGRVKAATVLSAGKQCDGKLTYGKNKGELSADKLDTSYRLEYDAIPKKLFVMGSRPAATIISAKSIYYYTVGGGLGYHLLKKDNMALDASAGASFQSYHYAMEDARNDMYIDFGENYTWEIVKDLNFVQKLTFSPQAEDWSVFRMVFEAGVSWAFYKNMTFNFTLIDKYDSHPAKNIDKNDLQLVSSIGLKF
jgi:putative salt-induced outer membrane protein YdiY